MKIADWQEPKSDQNWNPGTQVDIQVKCVLWLFISEVGGHRAESQHESQGTITIKSVSCAKDTNTIARFAPSLQEQIPPVHSGLPRMKTAGRHQLPRHNSVAACFFSWDAFIHHYRQTKKGGNLVLWHLMLTAGLGAQAKYLPTANRVESMSAC